jgi:hypothetical protein
MAKNTVEVKQIINDFVLTMEGDDYANNASDVLIRNYALRGIREMGFDIMRRIKSVKLQVNAALGTVSLPADFVDLTKIGILGSDGLVYVFGENENINVLENEPAASVPDYLTGFESYVFRNWVAESSMGGVYGLGGGHLPGEYRINYEYNRIELSSGTGVSEVVIEYIADEALSANPSIHVYAEEALRAYIYYKLVERKANVPAVEKSRARQQYYNERRLANARLKTFNKEEALKTIRKNYKQSPKF